MKNWRWLVTSACLVLGCISCKSPSDFQQDADDEAYEIIAEKQEMVLGTTGELRVETPYSKRKPAEIHAGEIIADRQKNPDASLVLSSLEETLKLATQKNRDYQLRKENLMLSALSLSDTRHGFSSIFSHTTTAQRSRTAGQRDAGSVDNQLSVSKVLERGGSIGLTLVNNLFQFYSGDPARSATSAISLNLVQPLLRGAGSEIASESLTQAERNVIYEIRSFSRYQRLFAVSIASLYFRLIQQRDTVFNEYSNYTSLVRARKRAQALSKDRKPEFEVDQTRQSELVARNRYLEAVERYQAELDDFKLQLGLTLDTDLKVAARGLDELKKLKLRQTTVTPRAAFGIALQKRLDFLTSVDRFDDAKRKVNVSENQLLTDIEVFANASVASSGERNYETFNFKNWQGGAGIRFKLPLDRLLERNAYRRERISFERELRSLATSVDNLKTEIRGALRRLDQRAQSFRIQSASVELAERRVESASLLLQAGRASTRDLLEAQDSLLSAQNSLSRNLVDYHLARLELLRDMGQLDLRDGTIIELQTIDTKPTKQEAGDDVILPTPGEIFGEEETRK